jgi:hypothetical protein
VLGLLRLRQGKAWGKILGWNRPTIMVSFEYS